MIIAMSVSLADRSEAAINDAIGTALESAVRRALAMGLASVELVSARMGGDHLDVRVRAIDANEDETSPSQPVLARAGDRR